MCECEAHAIGSIELIAIPIAIGRATVHTITVRDNFAKSCANSQAPTPARLRSLAFRKRKLAPPRAVRAYPSPDTSPAPRPAPPTPPTPFAQLRLRAELDVGNKPIAGSWDQGLSSRLAWPGNHARRNRGQAGVLRRVMVS